MQKKKSYMDRGNIITEGFFKALLWLVMKPKVTGLVNKLKDDPELARLTKKANAAVKKANKALEKSNSKQAKRLKKQGFATNVGSAVGKHIKW